MEQEEAERPWWEDIPQATRIDIKPTEEQKKELEVKRKITRGCALRFFGIIIRIYCFLIGVLMLGYGGWILYEVKSNLTPLNILANIAMGGFLLVTGILTVLAESRTRRTMDRCLKTYIIISNHLARGLFYIVVGGLTFPINVQLPYIGTFGDSKILAGFIVAGGAMSLVYAPFMFRYRRRKGVTKQVRSIAYAEEIAYEFNIIKPQPVAAAHPYSKADCELQNITNGAEFEEVDLDSNKRRNGVNLSGCPAM